MLPTRAQRLHAGPAPCRYCRMRRSIVTVSRILLVIALVGLTYYSLTPSAPGSPFGSDKVWHALAYAALAFLMVMSLRDAPAQIGRVLILALAVMAYGAAIEALQPYTGRSFDTADMLANVVGVVVGAGSGLVVRTVLERPHHRGDTADNDTRK